MTEPSMFRRDFLALGAAATALGIAPQAVASAANPVKASLRLKWLPQSQFAGFYVAREKGYYLQEGIDLTINPGGPNLLTENLVASGADTFGLSGGTESVLAAHDKNLPLVAVGMAHQLTPFVFVARKDGPVKSLEDFRGKKVTAWFTGSQLVLQGMLASKGIQPGEVTIQPQQVSQTPFVNGEVDVVVAAQYNDLLIIQSRMGADKLRLFVPEDYGVSFPRDTLIVSKKTSQEQPELVKSFLRASIRGWQDTLKNPTQAVDTLLKVAPTLERSHQEAGLKEALRLMTAGQATTKGLFYLDMGAIGKAQDLLLQAKVLSKPADLPQVFNSALLDSIPLASRLP